MNIDLKPCPFCGKAAKIIRIPVDYAHNEYSVECSSWKCRVSTQYYENRKSAAAAWNKRFT